MDRSNYEGRNHSKAEIWLSVGQAAILLDKTDRTVRKNCGAGKYRAEKVIANGGEQYRILLSSLSPSVQAKYHREQLEKEHPPERDRALTDELNALARQNARKAAAAGQPVKPEKALPVRLDQAGTNEVWAAWDHASEGHQKEAEFRRDVLLEYAAMEKAGIPKGTIEKELGERHGLCPVTLWRLRKLVANQAVGNWLPLLLPKWKGRTARAEFSEDAWEFIRGRWGVQSKPTVSSVYRQAQALAPAKGWKLPSLDVVERRINALPRWQRIYYREGAKALKALYPHQERDYSTLRVHDIWCSDGRKADVFCRWTNRDGSFTVGRPIIVGWADVRTRYLLGFEIGRTESADLIRLAFKKALETARVIPEEALMDNGRGYASKQMTGGTPNRYRFKVKEEDVEGVLTLMGVDVIWATPGHGQAKPIESFWRTLADMDKRAEFRGAYVGNCPEDRPEEWDPKKAVPIEVYKEVLIRELNAYHQRRGHRGDGMNGRSPAEVFAALLDLAPPRKQPSAQQLRLCLLAAEAVKIDRTSSTVKILGNRYWTEALADLDVNRTYTARFNPEDASQPIYLYDGSRFICEAKIRDKVGFRNQEAAREHNRARNKTIKGQKLIAEGLRERHDAERWAIPETAQLPFDQSTGEVLADPPAPKAAELFRPAPDLPPTPPKPEKTETNGKFFGSVVQKMRALNGER
jgi:putative transposase